MNPGNGIETLRLATLMPFARFPINESRQRDWNPTQEEVLGTNGDFLLMNPGNGIETFLNIFFRLGWMISY